MDECLHLTLVPLADDSPANRAHAGAGKAWFCHECGSTFFLELIPATIHVTNGRPQKKAS